MSFQNTVVLTIANGAVVSNSVNLFGAGVQTILTTSAAWDAADLTLEASPDGVNWGTLYTTQGNAIRLTGFTTGRVYLMGEPAMPELEGVTFFRVRSTTNAGVDVPQTAARTILLTLEADS